MKRLFSAIGLLTVFALTNFSYGQTYLTKANIPFAFQVGKTMMPAGTYFFRQSGFLLTIKDKTGHASAMVLTYPESRRGTKAYGSLEFQQYGNDHFLRKVWDGNSTGCALPASKREKLLARRATFGKTEQVALQTNGH